jgi:hypothetical protein
MAVNYVRVVKADFFVNPGRKCDRPVSFDQDNRVKEKQSMYSS